MRKMRILRYPGLCLCLAFCLAMFSCAVKYYAGQPLAAVSNDTSVCLYKLEIRVMPVKRAAIIWGDDGWFHFQQYNTVRPASYANSHTFSLLYRTNDTGQVQLLKEQLLGTGIVEQVNIVKISN